MLLVGPKTTRNHYHNMMSISVVFVAVVEVASARYTQEAVANLPVSSQRLRIHASDRWGMRTMKLVAAAVVAMTLSKMMGLMVNWSIGVLLLMWQQPPLVLLFVVSSVP